MLILSQDGETLYDTRSGFGIRVHKIGGKGELRGDTHDGWYLMGEYETPTEAKEALRELYRNATNGRNYNEF